MQANKNVALSINNLQIEGTVTLKGDPLDDENSGFIRMFKEKRPEVYKNWGPMLEDSNSNERVLEITPTRIAFYRGGPDLHRDIMNIPKKKAFKMDSSDMGSTYE